MEKSVKRLVIFLFIVLISSSACADEKNAVGNINLGNSNNSGNTEDTGNSGSSGNTGDTGAMENSAVKITINGQVFNAVFYNNETAKAFINMMPLTLKMSELNGNEKYYNLPNTLPVNSERVGSIKKGDIMLYGNNCIVIFYESFNTSYSYTKIGYIENTDNLAGALGTGSVNVTFKK